MKAGLPNRVRFGAFELDLRAGELRKGERKVLLQGQPFQILLMLIERHGDLVTLGEIKKKLWPNDTVVEFDHSIYTAIKKLRQALVDPADNPKYVETVARRGYRLIVPVEAVSSNDSWGPIPTHSQQAGEKDGTPPAGESGEGAGPERAEGWESGLIGKKVSHYRVLEIIGGGGMGLVYKAEDLKLGRRVALKFLPEELISDPIALQRFEREAQTASSLNHPNICTIFEVEEHERQPFIVMELLEGETLRDRLAAAASDEKAIPLDDLLRIGIQVADGLEVAHEQGIIHRDIKPANIFLTRKGTAKILDFGLAKPATTLADLECTAGENAECHPCASRGIPPSGDQTLTRAGAAMGTAGYMSPEQVRGERLDARTDLFSFGLVLYEMFSGQRAFSGDTAPVLKDAILNQAPVSIRALNSAVPPELEKVIDKTLQKERKERYQSAAEMRRDLLNVNREAQLVTSRAPLLRWRVLASAAVMLVAVIAGGYLWRRWRVSPKLTASDTVVLADFTNLTSEPAFASALRAALEVEFGQTPFLNVLSPEKVRGTLKLMGHPEDDKLTPQLARDVCMRTNSKALLRGSITDVGNQYRIDLRSVDCKTGNTLADSGVTVEDRNEIVKKLGEAGNSLREKLGEPASSRRQFSAQLDTATTSSVEALEAYAAGIASYGKLEAVSHFKHAEELDPNFALPYVAVARAYTNLDDYRGEFENLTKAYQLRERVTLRDRLDLEAFYSSDVTGEWEKALSTAQQAIQSFPRWGKPRNFLAYLWRLRGDNERAAAAARDAMRVMPDNMSPYTNLAVSYMVLNQMEDAKLIVELAKDRVPDNWSLHFIAYRLAFLQNNQNGMQQQVRWAEGQPGLEELILWQQSQTEAYYGRLRKADELSKQARELASRAGAPGKSAERKASEALRAAKIGRITRELRPAREVISLNSTPRAKHLAALVLARAGDTASALQVAQQLEQQFPLNTLIGGWELPTIRAAVYLQQGRPDSAIEALEQAAPFDLRYSPQFGSDPDFGLEPAYIRGEAYLKAGQAKRAAEEFRKLLEHPGIVGNSINGPLAHLQLGRAQAMMGDKAAARKSYQDFLTLWKDADPDIPIYQQAKAEYAKL